MNTGDAFYLASGLVFIAIGIILVATRRRQPPALALATYVLGLGIMYATNAAWGRTNVPMGLQGLLGLAAAGGLARFALLFPTRISGRAWVDAGIAGAYGSVFILSLVWLGWRAGSSSLREMLVGAGGPGSIFILVSSTVIAVVSVAASLLLPLRALRLERNDAGTMRGLGMLAVAYLLVTPGGPFPAIVASARGLAPLASGVIVFLGAILYQSLWLLSTNGHHARAARNIMLALIGLTLGLGAVHHVAGNLVVPVGRLLSALFLAYAVVAGQIEGLDVKVRWGISRGTIAAAFIAVFFVASEGAQIVFGSENPWIGLAAAGALVFAIAPLQRAGERLAQHAVPVTGGPRSAPFVEAEAAYVAAVRAATRDDILTRREERHLADVAEHLGIGPKRALELRELVEQEVVA